jgi:glycosyltransferase involved in cell wall biosynthesis
MSSKSMVTAIVIFLNAGETFFREAIESVLAQTYDNWELLLVDDGSTDISSEIAREYVSKYPNRVRYLEHEGHQNRGMSAARNLGIQHASGEYIAFLDADDLWLPQKLARQVAILESYPAVAMVYSSTWMWYGWTGDPEDIKLDRGRVLGIQPDRVVQPPMLLTLSLAGKSETPGTCSVLIRREIIQAVGGGEESFRGMFEDQALLAKICARSPVFVASGHWDRYRQHSHSCCHVAQDCGTYDPIQPNAARQNYLNWLESYLAAQGMQDTDVWRVLQTSLERYRHPGRYRLREIARYWQKIYSKLVGIARFKPPHSIVENSSGN